MSPAPVVLLKHKELPTEASGSELSAAKPPPPPVPPLPSKVAKNKSSLWGGQTKSTKWEGKGCNWGPFGQRPIIFYCYLIHLFFVTKIKELLEWPRGVE